MTEELVQIGTHDLRGALCKGGGFTMLELRDADDGDCTIVNEDDLVALRDFINLVIEEIDK